MLVGTSDCHGKEDTEEKGNAERVLEAELLLSSPSAVGWVVLASHITSLSLSFLYKMGE